MMEQQKNRNVYLTPNTSCLASSTTPQKQNVVSHCATHVLISLLFTTCVLLTLPLSAHASVITKPTNNLGLVGYWNFNEGTSTYAGDYSANNNKGTLTNMANPPTAGSGWGNGKFGKGLNFDGTNDYVNVPNVPLPTNDFTYSLWTNLDTNNDEMLVMASDGGGLNEFFIHITSGKLAVTVNNTNLSNSTASIPTAIWTHITVVRSGSTVTYYLNGVSDSSRTGSGTLNFGSCQLLLGVDADATCAGTLGNFLDGRLDDVRIYNRALSATEVAGLYKSTGSNFGSSQTLTQGTTLANGLVGHWTFDGSKTTNTTALDSSGQNNTGTFTGFTRATNAKAGKLGQGMNFDGVNDYVDEGDIAAIDTATALTVCAWVKHDTLTADNPIVTKEETTSGDGVVFMRDDVGYVSGRTDTYIIYFADSADSDDARLEGATNLSVADVWIHVCGTFQASSATGLRLYKNGVEDANSPVSTANVGAINAGVDTVKIGTRTNTPATYFDGSIDDVRIYSRALSASEVKQLYNLGSAKAQASSVTLQQGTTLGSGIVGHWTFDGKDTTNTTATDLSGQGNTGTFTNFTRATNAKAGKLGQGLSFDGTNDYVAVTGSPSVQNVSYWIKPTGNKYSLGLSGAKRYFLNNGLYSGVNTATRYINAVVPSGETLGSEILTNGTLETGATSPWVGLGTWGSAAMSLAITTSSPYAGTYALDGNITDGGFASWHVQLRHGSSITLTSGNLYKVQFAAKGSVAKSGLISYYVMTNGAGTQASPAFTFDLTTSWVLHTYYFYSTASADSIQLYFNLGNNGAYHIYLDNISTKPVSSVGDVTNNQWNFVSVNLDSPVSADSINLGNVDSRFLNGTLDDVRFYNRALSANEVKQLYLMGR